MADSPDTDAEMNTTVDKKRKLLPGWMTGFGAQVIAGLIIGLILGFIARAQSSGLSGDKEGGQGSLLDGVGTAYVQLLKVMIPPLVVTAVITSVANLRKVTNAARLAISTLVWFAITAFFSVLAGIIVALVMKPGEGTSVDASTAADPSHTGSWLAFIEGIVPSNILGLGASTASSGDGIDLSFNVLQLLVISLAIGIAAVKT